MKDGTEAPTFVAPSEVPLTTAFKCYGIGQLVYELERPYPASRCFGFRVSEKSRLQQLAQQGFKFPAHVSSTALAPASVAGGARAPGDPDSALSQPIKEDSLSLIRRDICLGVLSLDTTVLDVPRCRGTYVLVLAEADHDDDSLSLKRSQPVQLSHEVPPPIMSNRTIFDELDSEQNDDVVAIDFSSLRFNGSEDVRKLVSDVQCRAQAIAGVLSYALMQQVFCNPRYLINATYERVGLIQQRALTLVYQSMRFCEKLARWKPFPK